MPLITDFVNDYDNNEFSLNFGAGLEVMEMMHETFYFQLGFIF